MNALVLAQVDYFKRIVAESADEKSFAGRIAVQMIDAPLHSWQRDCCLKFEWIVFGKGDA